ncbi:MAG: RDD family protein [Methanosarcina sp.]
MGEWFNTETVSVTGESGKYFEYVNGEKTIKKTRLGDVWKRCAAYILDVFLVNLFVFLILIAVTLTKDPLAEIYGIAFTNLAIFAYFVYFESSKAQATLGKKWMNLKVVDFEGKRISFLRAFFRYFARGMPTIVLVVVDVATNGTGIINEHLGFYFLIPIVTYAPILFMDMRQGVHDVMAGTVVVKNYPGYK